MSCIKILVRAPNWIGDQILAYPFFYYLRKAYPEAEITSVCVPWVEEVQFRKLVNQVIVIPSPHAGAGFLQRLKVMEEAAKKIRLQGPWNMGISLPQSFSSAWILFRSQVQLRRGYATEGRSMLLNDLVAAPVGKEFHRAESYVHLLPEIARPTGSMKEFWGVPSQDELDPGTPGILEKFDAEREWNRHVPLDPPSYPYWVLAPGSMAESRRWDLERFLVLSKKIYGATQLPCLIVGGPKEAPLATRLKESRDVKFMDYTAQGPPSVLSRIFAQARFTVSNDSGLAHIASLCGSTVYVIWGAGNPKSTEPLGPGKVRMFFNPVTCWPCEKNSCDQIGDQRLSCLKGIEPDTVWEELRRDVRI